MHTTGSHNGASNIGKYASLINGVHDWVVLVSKGMLMESLSRPMIGPSILNKPSHWLILTLSFYFWEYARPELNLLYNEHFRDLIFDFNALNKL